LSKICIAIGSLVKSGAERGIEDIARELSKKHDVTLVAYQKKGAPSAGWEDHRVELVEFEFGVLNYYVLSPMRLVAKLREIAPDICIQGNVGDLTGYLGAYCRLHDCRFVYHSTCNWDTMPWSSLQISDTPASIFWYELGLATADLIVTQTHDIAATFRRKFLGLKRVAYVPPMYDASPVPVPRKKSNYALWMARMVWYKRPELFVRLARSLPDCEFVMAGGGPLASHVERMSKAVPNLRFLGNVEHFVAERLSSEARLFVNTSTYEGFPLTFLESAARRTPLVSLYYDPDEIICRFGLGCHSRSFDKLVDDVSNLMDDDGLCKMYGSNIRNYVLENHSPRVAMAAYERELSRLPIRTNAHLRE
jgi:glycosyltransferase involved in cell wall biosynthesis